MSPSKATRDGTTQAYVDVWCDGGCSGNPGPMAVGVVMMTDIKGEIKDIIVHGYALPYEGTNNQAEYLAIIEGIEMARKQCVQWDDNVIVNLFTDSQLAYQQLRGDWTLTDQKMINLHAVAKQALKFFDDSETYHLKVYKASQHETRQAHNVAMIAMTKLKDSGIP